MRRRSLIGHDRDSSGRAKRSQATAGRELRSASREHDGQGAVGEGKGAKGVQRAIEAVFVSSVRVLGANDAKMICARFCAARKT